METELKITKYNIAVMLGWVAVCIGIISSLLRIFLNIKYGLWFGVIGLVFGGLTITFGGPLKTIEIKKVDLKPFVPGEDTKEDSEKGENT